MNNTYACWILRMQDKTNLVCPGEIVKRVLTINIATVKVKRAQRNSTWIESQHWTDELRKKVIKVTGKPYLIGDCQPICSIFNINSLLIICTKMFDFSISSDGRQPRKTSNFRKCRCIDLFPCKKIVSIVEYKEKKEKNLQIPGAWQVLSAWAPIHHRSCQRCHCNPHYSFGCTL